MDAATSRYVFQNATVVTMDPQTGTLPAADLVVEGDQIAGIFPAGTSAATPQQGGEVIDVAGGIVLPGFIDTHRHCWQTPLRRMIPDVDDMAGYLDATHKSLALRYRPEDMFVGSYLAALGAIDSGITSLVDFSHNSRSAAHIDQALAGLIASGIRGTLAYGPALAGPWDRQWPDDVERVRAEACARGESRTTVRLAVQGSPHFAGPETTLSAAMVRRARSVQAGVSVDGVIGPAASGIIEQLGADGVLGPDVTLIHCQAISSRAWDVIAESGAGVSLTVTSDAQIGIGDALTPIDQCLARGILPSLSIDVETVLPGDMFTQMRALLALQRMTFARGEASSGGRIGVRDVLDYATRGGAAVNGQAAITGTLGPGKKADLVVLRTDRIATFPSNDPIGTIVSGADSSNIDSVMVDGVFRKRSGRLLGVDLPGLLERATASRDYLLAARP